MCFAERRLRRAASAAWWGLSCLVLAMIVAGLPGCTRESVRAALAAQQRADEVQEAVFDRQHEGLCILLYRDLRQRLDQSGAALNAEQRAVLSAAWNDRDLVEFWRVQHERAKALRMVGVDAKLYGDQSAVDLLYKSLSAKAERIRNGLAARAGADLARDVAEEESGSE